MDEELSAEVKMRMTASQLESLDRVARQDQRPTSSMARWIIQKYLMEHDSEFRRLMESGGPGDPGQTPPSPGGKYRITRKLKKAAERAKGDSQRLEESGKSKISAAFENQDQSSKGIHTSPESGIG